MRKAVDNWNKCMTSHETLWWQETMKGTVYLDDDKFLKHVYKNRFFIFRIIISTVKPYWKNM